ncbi:histidine phosphatase family protein [Dermatophilaceae bacterium Soc4.6]
MPTVHVHLVRHGQSTWNREGRLQGQTIHPPLTELGRSQAVRAATTVAGLLDGPAVLWSSDLVRAAKTASVIGTRIGLPVLHDEALREQSLGRLEGRLARSLQAEPTPPDMHVGDIRWGGGESTADVYRRMGRFLEREVPRPTRDSGRGQHLVLVSHGDAIRVARAWLLGRGHRDLHWDSLPNGSVTSVQLGRQD